MLFDIDTEIADIRLGIAARREKEGEEAAEAIADGADLPGAKRLALIAPPYETAPVNISLVYRKDRLAEPPMAWMRDLTREVAAGL